MPPFAVLYLTDLHENVITILVCIALAPVVATAALLLNRAIFGRTPWR